MREVFVSLSELKRVTRQLGNRVLYRGHSSADYRLVPTLGRLEMDSASLTEIEKTIFLRFKLLSHQYFGNQARSDLDWLILARHYGLNTRILDWTRSVYVALYFALHGRSKIKHEPFSIIAYKDPNIQSYFELRDSNPFGFSDDVFFEPPNMDSRISNQQSILSIHPSPSQDIEGENIFQMNIFPSLSNLKEIELELSEVGISHSTIFPGPEGIARHLNDSPHEMDAPLNLKQEGPAWKPVADWMVGKTRKEIENVLFKDKNFVALLEMHLDNPSYLIGMPVNYDNGKVGFLRSYIPGENRIIVLSQNGLSKKSIRIDSDEIKGVKVSGNALKEMFGKNMVFIRKIRGKADDKNSLRVKDRLHRP